MPKNRRLSARLALFCGAVTAFGVLTPVNPAAADGPGSGTPTIVSVGDSYISGEGGRWAGNTTSKSSTTVDALGATAYYDNATKTAEQVERCHRSASAEVHVAGGVKSINLACSGATTNTATGTYFKPGLDFYDNGAGRQGQAKLLQTVAAANNVRMVVVSIGGNDFNFGTIVQQCVQDFLASSSWFPDYCNDDSTVTANFTSTNIATQRAKIKNALLNVRTAMRNAGYADTQWTLAVQTYPSPLATGSNYRYSESGYTRQNTGGCGFWNADASWATNTALGTINNTVAGAITDSGITGVKTINLANALVGRRLCENTVGLLEEKSLSSWKSTGAVDKSEWVVQIRTVSTAIGNYYIQESLHPNYWGQLAVRNCVRQAYNGGAPKSGSCVRSATGLTSLGEPVMTLQ